MFYFTLVPFFDKSENAADNRETGDAKQSVGAEHDRPSNYEDISLQDSFKALVGCRDTISLGGSENFEEIARADVVACDVNNSTEDNADADTTKSVIELIKAIFFRKIKKWNKRSRGISDLTSDDRNDSIGKRSDSNSERRFEFKSSRTLETVESSPTTTNTSSNFAARRSKRRAPAPIRHDHDTWMERFAVVEAPRGPSGQMIVRSYFESVCTRTKVWDEPPSGATFIEYATPHARKMAEVQLTQVNGSSLMHGIRTNSAGSIGGQNKKVNNRLFSQALRERLRHTKKKVGKSKEPRNFSPPLIEIVDHNNYDQRGQHITSMDIPIGAEALSAAKDTSQISEQQEIESGLFNAEKESSIFYEDIELAKALSLSLEENKSQDNLEEAEKKTNQDCVLS